MNETVFIVLGEAGEHGEQQTWVAGVFRTREEAEQSMSEKLARNRTYETWYERFLDALAEQNQHGGVWERRGTSFDEAQRRAKAQAGPQPPHEDMERGKIVEAVIGQ